MASTFDNDLRLEEMATGENAGSWGTKTNTNLELIADAFGYGTFTIADADTTLTMPDGSDTDNALRSLYLKISSSADLTTTRTLTLAPNTVSKLWYIENNTSGGQTITISQGSGANISILNGQAKLIATDGAGAGAAVIDVTQDLAIPDLFVDDDLSLQSDGAIINFGADADVSLTHVADTGLRLNDAMALEFRDGDLSINSSADGQLDIDADTTVQIATTTLDVDANTQIDGTVNVGVDDTGYDVKFFGATSGKYMLWDESADTLAVEGDLTVDTDTLYVDSTNNTVGFGTSTPQARIDSSAVSNFSVTYNDFTGDGLHIQSTGTAGSGAYAGGISFSRISADNNSRAAGIAAVQTDTDADKVGLAFFTHPDATTSNDLSEAMRIDAAQRVLIGSTGTYGTINANPALQVHGLTYDKAMVSAYRYDNGAGSPAHFTMSKSRGTSVGTQTIVQSGDTIGQINFAGSDGTDFESLGNIAAQVDGTPGNNDMPGRLVFSTTPDGSISPAERMRINSSGDVGIDVGGDPDYRLHVKGTGISGSIVLEDESASSSAPVIQSWAKRSDANLSQSFSGGLALTGQRTDTYVPNGKAVGSIYFGGNHTDGSSGNILFASSIVGEAEANFTSSSAMGTALVFKTGSTGVALGTANADYGTEAMRIDSSQRVLIGTASAYTSFFNNDVDPQFQVVGADSGASSVAVVRTSNDGDGPSYLFGRMRSTSHGIVQNNDRIGRLTYQAADGVALQQSASIDAYVDGPPGVNDTPARIVFSTTADGANTYTERMRITNGGDVLVGTTTNSISSEGIVFHQNKYIGVARDGATTMYLNRITSDGTIVEFRKDNSAVGSIGSVASNYLSIGTGDTGILFQDDNDFIEPCNVSTSSGRDAAIDLGASGGRFKDLYLSGGVYLGGTGSANKLDDYEEGDYTVSFAPSVSGSITISNSTTTGHYTKVGNLVTITASINVSAASSPNGYISVNIPFAASSAATQTGRSAVSIYADILNTGANIGDFIGLTIDGTSNLRVYLGDSHNAQADAAQQIKTGSYFLITCSYIAA